jgi:hypothetical protein
VVGLVVRAHSHWVAQRIPRTARRSCPCRRSQAVLRPASFVLLHSSRACTSPARARASVVARRPVCGLLHGRECRSTSTKETPLSTVTAVDTAGTLRRTSARGRSERWYKRTARRGQSPPQAPPRPGPHPHRPQRVYGVTPSRFFLERDDKRFSESETPHKSQKSQGRTHDNGSPTAALRTCTGAGACGTGPRSVFG